MRNPGILNRSKLILTGIISLGMAYQAILAAAPCPCDIYATGGTPCVSAHSTVRALYSTYNGPLYQVTRKSDNKTKDIGVLTPGGFANAAAQDSFLAGTPGHITIIYDQSGNGNNLTPAPSGAWLPADTAALASSGAIKLDGYTVHGVYVDGKFPTSRSDTTSKAVGYRNNVTTGMPKGNDAEGMYMVVDGTHYSDYCCFDYGNAGTTNQAQGAATMEALYFGPWGSMGHGAGAGPWILADLESGLFGGSTKVDTTTKTIIASFVIGMLKGDTVNRYVLKAFDAQSGVLKSKYDGPRPTGYYPMKKSGAVILGIGGDNSHGGDGTFFEGAITRGFPLDATENAVQANITAAGYGSTTTAVAYRSNGTLPGNSLGVRYHSSRGTMVISYTLQNAGSVSMMVFDPSGRRIAAIVNGSVAAGRHEALWDAKRVPSGVYACKIAIDGQDEWSGKIVVDK
jgi:hypothetical protein